MSKGWAAASLYYFLWRKGRITEDELNSFCQEGSKFIGLAEPIIPEIMIAGGSMQMGLPGAVGLALAKKIKGEEGIIYCLMSDGELAGGMIWESALISAQHKLDNLVVIIDRNFLQAMGKTEEILSIESVKDKWQSFGWEWSINDGHNYEELHNRLGSVQWISDRTNAPQVIIANTIKGKGWQRAENNNLYHYKSPNKDEYEEALKELNV